jgi:transposase
LPPARLGRAHHPNKWRQGLLYLPPYSPDLNPIEKAWSKLKLLLRSVKARTKEALEEAISELLPQLSSGNAEAWFRTRFGTL